MAVYFPLRTTFDASQQVWIVVFPFSFASMYFFIPSLISWLTYLVFRMLFNFHVFVVFPDFFLVDFLFYSIVVREDAWYDFNLELVQACSVGLHVICSGE